MDCYALIPKWDTRYEKEFGECVLPQGHDGYHLTKLNNGSYLSWGGDGCDEECEWCGECFCHINISEKQALVIMNDLSKNFCDEP